MLVRKLSDTNSWYMQDPTLPTPKSTTHESMDIGRKLQTKFRIIFRKQLNFQSYPMDFHSIYGDEKIYSRNDIQSSYKRDYPIPKTMICSDIRTKKVDDEPPDTLFNRKTVSEFEIHPWAASKFMDDHMINVPEARKKINFFRQMRFKSLVIP